MFNNNQTLNVTSYDRAARPTDMEEGEFDAPDPEPSRERPNTMSWLEDSCQRDRFVIQQRQGKETDVYWNDGLREPVLDYDGTLEQKAGVSWYWCDY